MSDSSSEGGPGGNGANGNGGGGSGPLDPQQHPAQAVIQVFGGIRPMAHKLGIAVSTVQGWKERGTIPRSRHPEIQAAAAGAGLALDPQLLAASDQTQPPVIEGVGAPVAEPVEAPPPAASPGPAPAALHPEREAPGWLRRLAPQLPAVALGGVLVVAGVLLAMGTSDLWLAGSTAPQGDLGALETRLAALEARPAGVADPDPRLAALEGRLEALRQQLAALPSGGDPAALQALRAELLAAATAAVQPALEASAGQLAALGAALDETRKELADLAARIQSLPADGVAAGELKQTLGADIAQLTERILALEATTGAQASRLGALDTLDQRIADSVGAAEARLARELETRLAGALAALPAPAAPATDPGAATLALAAAGLKEAVAAGRAYGSELALLRQLAAGDAALGSALDRLAPLAEQGLAPESRLLAEFPAVAQAIVAAERGDAGGGDWFEDLWLSLGDLVTVRPIGEVAGDGAAARVARAEQRLAAGDLAAAVAELEGLAGAPAEAAAPWLAAAKGRLEALAAADALMQQALARLAAGG
jgi:hypothetical protein